LASPFQEGFIEGDGRAHAIMMVASVHHDVQRWTQLLARNGRVNSHGV
jgi:hypothetical protein